MSEKVEFRNCQLEGPVSLFTPNSLISDCHFIDCEAIIVKPGTLLKVAVAFNNSRFIGCAIRRVSFIFTAKDYVRVFTKEQRYQIPVIATERRETYNRFSWSPAK
jgi:hypothetical protein